MYACLRALVIVGVGLNLGCSQKSETADAQFVERLAKEVHDLTEKVQTLEAKVDFAENIYKTAAFDPTGEKAFQRIDSNNGRFFVTLDKVEPYSDGQKITLLIGNPNNVTFHGCELDVTWGNRWPDGKVRDKDAMKAYYATEKKKRISLTDTLWPGLWNRVSFTIGPAKTDEFGRLEVGITTHQISFTRAR